MQGPSHVCSSHLATVRLVQPGPTGWHDPPLLMPAVTHRALLTVVLTNLAGRPSLFVDNSGPQFPSTGCAHQTGTRDMAACRQPAISNMETLGSKGCS